MRGWQVGISGHVQHWLPLADFTRALACGLSLCILMNAYSGMPTFALVFLLSSRSGCSVCIRNADTHSENVLWLSAYTKLCFGCLLYFIIGELFSSLSIWMSSKITSQSSELILDWVILSDAHNTYNGNWTIKPHKNGWPSGWVATNHLAVCVIC